MPKRVKQAKRDANQIAFDVVRKSTKKADEVPTDFMEQYRAHMASLGKKGGAIGGKRRLETMTPEQRSQIALKAAMARWSKKKK